MSQCKSFSFGVDHVSFIDDQFNVYSVDDPQKFSVNLTFEKSQHRGGTNNDVRASAIHTRNGEVSLGTGYIDADLAKLLGGGTITSLGTSAASINTGTVNGVNTLYGTTATLCTAISTITINSPTLIKTSDYYIKATAVNKLLVTRVDDGKQFSEVTVTASSTGHVLDSERGIVFSTTEGGVSLTTSEKAYVSARVAINSFNTKIVFDDNKPGKLTMRAIIDYNGARRTINIPVVQPSGTIQGNGATEFQVQDLVMSLENSAALNELADIVLQG